MYTTSWQLRAQAEIERRKRKQDNSEPKLWQPNPDHEDGISNPQRLGIESQADILGFGGCAGGGKSSLLLGCAFTQHKRSVILRRVYPNLKGLIEDSIELIGSDEHFNKTEKTWRLDGRLLEFGAVQYEDDKYAWRGRPHDFYGFDEVTEFSRSQVEFIIGWLRSTDPGQRCRVMMTFNPPNNEAGSWVIDYFMPWLAYLFPANFQHPNPAKPGELRWYATIDGKEIEQSNGEPFEHNGKMIKPLSRTFIPSRLKDNPHLAGTNYEAVLQSLPEPLRSQLLDGDFAASREADPWQVIPTDWVRLAQQRWLERERPQMPLTSVGIDAVRGGKDNLAIAEQYDNWFAEVHKVPGVKVEDGPALAAIVYQRMDGKQPSQQMNIDVIGIGSSGYDSLKVMYPNVIPVNVAEGSDYRDKSGKLKVRNKRAEMYWRFREALDPVYGDDLALPPGNEIVADLCAARWELTTAGVQIEPKEKIKARLGRSPDVGEAILLAHFQTFPVSLTWLKSLEQQVAALQER